MKSTFYPWNHVVYQLESSPKVTGAVAFGFSRLKVPLLPDSPFLKDDKNVCTVIHGRFRPGDALHEFNSSCTLLSTHLNKAD